MFAIIRTGGKQYKVAPGDTISVEKLEGVDGTSLHLSDVLMLCNEGVIKVGSPILQDAYVQATIVEQIRGDKVIVFKKKRRNNYRRKKGHRQFLTVLKITDVLASGASKEELSALKNTESKDNHG
jgi:large subunit ribosomal protein L21